MVEMLVVVGAVIIGLMLKPPVRMLLSWLNSCYLREFAATQEVLLTFKALK
jgi:hypothetical protein